MITPILIVGLSIAVLLAAYLAICALAQRAYLMGRNDALQTRPAEILKAKTEGMRAERELWVRSGLVDLKPLDLDLKPFDPIVAHRASGAPVRQSELQTLAPDSEATYGGGIEIHDLANAVIEAQTQNKFQQ